MQVVSVDVDNIFATLFDCHDNVLEKLKNEVQINHLHIERFHVVKRLRKSVQYVRMHQFFGRVVSLVHK